MSGVSADSPHISTDSDLSSTLKAKATMQTRKRHQFGMLNNEAAAPSRVKKSPQRAAALTDMTALENNENQCPNIAVKGNVAKMAKLFDAETCVAKATKAAAVQQKNQNIDCTNKDDRNKEARRKIMLQERRMEKAMSQKFEKLSSIPVERSLCEDFSMEAGDTTEIRVEMYGVKRKSDTLSVKSVVVFDGSYESRVDACTVIARLILAGLALYQVQIHCSVTRQFFSSAMEQMKCSFGELLNWVDSSRIISGNILVFRVLLELRRSLGVDTTLSWEDCLHLAFVGTFLIRGACWSSKSCLKSTSTWYWNCSLFVASAACWLMILPVYNSCDSESSKYCFFANNKAVLTPRYSWLDVTAAQFYKSISTQLKSKIKGRLFKEARRAFVNPLRFHGRIKKLFTFIRWAKFLAPLIGTCNKLRGHILDMMKKKGQHLTSKTARSMWSDLLDALTAQSKQERAVLQLQKCFREKRERKARRRMDLISSQRPGALNIRKRLREERNLSKSKLIKMERLDSERQLRRQVSEQEKVNIVKHKESRKRDKKRLLLSPKTAFAVGWKYVAISCVILEVSQIMFAPLLSGELKKMPLNEFLSVVLFASCDDKNADHMCSTSPLKHNWLMAVHVFSRFLVPFVHAVTFLDVFVTFSTGELTVTGKLIPKPFFARYILPGIGLQMIVNPTMVAFSQWIKRATAHSIHVGPSLCFHLMLELLPLANWIYDKLLDVVIDFVDRQNKIISSRSVNIF